MKRNMDIIREILLFSEKSDVSPLEWIELDLPYSKNELSYHTELLGEAGFLEVQDNSNSDDEGYDVSPKRLTWNGHEYLDSIRDPEIWRKTKESMEVVGGFSFEMLGALAKGFLKKKIENHTGIILEF